MRPVRLYQPRDEAFELFNVQETFAQHLAKSRTGDL